MNIYNCNCYRDVDICDITTNRDLTRSLVYTMPRHQAIRLKDKFERSVLLSLCTDFVGFCYSLGFGTTGDSGDS